MRIAVTDNMGAEHKLQQYFAWLKRGDPDIGIVKLSYPLGNEAELEHSDALVLTGGGDVDPALYGGPPDHPKVSGVDRRRDEFECAVLNRAMERKIPVLGICRGLQLANVHFGGTLVVDIEEAGYGQHTSRKGFENRHELTVESGSVLHRAGGVRRGEVNSSHHQSAYDSGSGLHVTARARDGVVEALELAEGKDYPFFLLIQWHPERMSDVDNPFSRSIVQAFITSIHKGEETTMKNKEK